MEQRRAEPEHLGLGGLDVLHPDVQVLLLGLLRVRPPRRDPRLRALERQLPPALVAADHHPGAVAVVLVDPHAEHLAVERAERPRVGAVEHGLLQSADQWSPPRSGLAAGGRGGPSPATPSATPPVEPGRLTISVRPATPARPRESTEVGTCSAPCRRTASAMPGASRSSTARVASGVTSVGDSPVPPVVRTTSAPDATASRNASVRASRSSGSTREPSTAKPSTLSPSTRNWPLRSS